MTSGAHFIPREDDQLSLWASNFASEAYSWWSAQGIDNPEAFALFALSEAYSAALAENIAAQAAARAAKQNKDAARGALEAQVRLVARVLQAQPNMTNEDRALIGITVRKTSAGALPVPASAPLARVAEIERLRHVVKFVDSASPTKSKKPRGVWCCEVRLKLVGPASENANAPQDPATMQPLALSTDGKVIADFEVQHAGKQAVYVARWVNGTGEGGPWSEEVRATIAA